MNTNDPFDINNHNSKYAQHLVEHEHTFGNIHNIMQVLQIKKKGTHLNTIKRFHIHKEAAQNNHLNDDHTITEYLILFFNTYKTKLHTKTSSSHHSIDTHLSH
jgi:hypothetical protein